MIRKYQTLQEQKEGIFEMKYLSPTNTQQEQETYRLVYRHT